MVIPMVLINRCLCLVLDMPSTAIDSKQFSGAIMYTFPSISQSNLTKTKAKAYSTYSGSLQHP